MLTHRPFALRSLRAALLVACAAFVAACGGSTSGAPGDSCTTDNTGECYSPYLAFECWQGKLREVQCRGHGGCVTQGNTVMCDLSQNIAGDGCFHMYEGAGICSSDGKQALQCTNGTFVVAGSCPNGCYTQGTTVYCN